MSPAQNISHWRVRDLANFLVKVLFMHMLAVTIAGLALLFVFVLVSRLVNRAGGGAGGARLFIWIWLAIAAGNGAIGVIRAGLSPMIELGVFVVVFSVPAAIAWFAGKKLGS